MQARYVMDIGMILEDNRCYADGKGREYYIDYVLNRSSIRQWSLKKLADYGYDTEYRYLGGVSRLQVVLYINDYANFTNLFDRNLGYDLTRDIAGYSESSSRYSPISVPQPDDDNADLVIPIPVI